MTPRLGLLHFRYRDARTGKWIRARYRADRDEIAARYVEWEIIGPAEIRDVDPTARYFTPHSRQLGNLGPLIPLASSPRRVAIVGVAS